MKQKVFSKTELQKHAVITANDWKLTPKATQLSKSYAFPDFLSAFMFVAKIAVHAEVLQHHPDIELSYGKVKIKLTTHDVKGLTKKDLELAKKIDEIRDRLALGDN